jgi:hypothetical protein
VAVALGGAPTPAPRVIDPPTRGASFRDDAQAEAEAVRQASGFVVMRNPIPAAGAGDNPGRRGFEG